MPFFDLPLDQLKTYRSATPEPADFDAFWSATLEEARRFPLAPKFEPVGAGLPLVEIYDASFAGWGGHRINGWFIKPAGSKDPLPVVVKYIGYGGGRGFPHEQLFWAASGRAVLVMDTRGQGSGWSMGATPDPAGSDPSQPGFMTRGILDRNAYYYRRIFTDAVRALDAARSRDDIDPARIAVAGGSQGGGISIAAAGLDSGVRAAMPDVPFLCHFRRAVGLTTRDPYGEIVRYLAMHRDKAEAAFTTLSYFDGVNFAARSKASGLFSVALMDDICPPSTVYAAYNAFAGPKAIRIYDFNNHEGGGAFQDREQLRWLATVGC